MPSSPGITIPLIMSELQNKAIWLVLVMSNMCVELTMKAFVSISNAEACRACSPGSFE